MSAFFLILFLFSHVLSVLQAQGFDSAERVNDSPTYLWPLPSKFTSGNKTLTVDPQLSLVVGGNGGSSGILKLGFDRYKAIIFKNSYAGSSILRGRRLSYDISKMRVVVQSDSEDLQLGVDESYTLFVVKQDGQSIVGEATLEAKTVFGALRGLETFSQLCTFDYGSKSVLVNGAPWYIRDSPRFPYRGLLVGKLQIHQGTIYQLP